ncbi:hypothetical protein G6F37_005586 [Rhizopus arrhizus]|nr:hypothetical protein G6F38_009998 [Rhizopus arrhizus]KAG1158662.1 hypothetical protein G6F37_005586 [Rhizopus arrhizus]
MVAAADSPMSSISTFCSLAPRARTLLVKSSVNCIGWNPRLRPQLKRLVNILHSTITHANSLTNLINQDSFAEAWLLLVTYSRALEPYLQDTGYQQPWFMFVQQSSIYGCIKFHNAYALHDHMNFEKHRCRKQGLDREATAMEISHTIITPARKFKEAIPACISSQTGIEEACHIYLIKYLLLRDGIRWALWNKVVYLNALHFRNQEEDRNLYFRITIQTDGTYVALLKKRLDTQARYSLRFTVSRESAKYINNIPSANQQELKDSCVIVGLEEEICSTSQQDNSRKLRKYCRILQNIKTDNTVLAERYLIHSRALMLEEYVDFLRSHTEHTADFQAHCVNIPTNHATAYPIR